MNARVIHYTATGHALLEGTEAKGLEKAAVFVKTKQVGVVIDTIGRVQNPFYIARLNPGLEGVEVEVKS